MLDDKVTIIGLGEIGTAIYEDLSKHANIQVFGVDVDQKRLRDLHERGYLVGDKPPASDVYILAVYTTDQVLSVMRSIDGKNHPLISIESTIDPFVTPTIQSLAHTKNYDVVCFPHRFNPGDPEHCVFNLDRVLGAYDPAASERACAFYTRFMPRELIHVVPFEIAAISKLVENAQRFTDIVFAQTIKDLCDEHNIDFTQLRAAVNTKWNIDLKEARDGVKGKCLPKDASLLAQNSTNPFLHAILESNRDYIRRHTP